MKRAVTSLEFYIGRVEREITSVSKFAIYVYVIVGSSFQAICVKVRVNAFDLLCLSGKTDWKK